MPRAPDQIPGIATLPGPGIPAGAARPDPGHPGPPPVLEEDDDTAHSKLRIHSFKLLFQVLTVRGERASVAIASSESFGWMDQDLRRPRLCAAIVDRCTLGGSIIETGTDSCRLARPVRTDSARRFYREPIPPIGIATDLLISRFPRREYRVPSVWRP
jgi:hypothetical protein